MNYGELKTLVAGYLHRTDLTANIPDFIELARGRINRDLRVREMLTEVDTTPTTNPFDVPTRFLEMRDMYTAYNGRRVTLALVGRKQLNEYQQASSGPPFFYSIDGEQIETAPGGADREYTLIYYQGLAAFSADGDTNNVLAEHPAIYLYGALIEAHSYTQDLDLMQQALTNYTSEVREANNRAAAAESGASLQIQGAAQWY